MIIIDSYHKTGLKHYHVPILVYLCELGCKKYTKIHIEGQGHFISDLKVVIARIGADKWIYIDS